MTIRFNDVWRRRVTAAIVETESPVGVNLASFEPAADNLTDDSDVFEDAIEAAVADVSQTLYIGRGNYYVPTLSLTINAPLRIIGSGAVLRGNGNNLFASTLDLRVSGLKLQDFGTIHAGNSGACDIFEMDSIVASGCSYLMTGASLARRLVVRGGSFSNFDAGLIVLDDGTVRQQAVFVDNIADGISRYIFRCRGMGSLFFRDNEITNLTSTGYASTAAVARAIQFGFDEGNWVEGNTFDKIEATDANADIFYWTVGDLFFNNNRIGALSSVSGDARGIMEKSTIKKHAQCSGNTLFINGDGGYFTGSLLQLVSVADADSAAAAIISSNIAEKLILPLVYLFNDATTEAKRPRHVLVSGNIIKKHVGAISILRIAEGAYAVRVVGNTVGSHENENDLTPDFEANCRAVAVATTTDATLTADVEVHSNDIVFVDQTESRVSSLLWASALHAGNSIKIAAAGNTLSGATNLVRSRNVGGAIDIVIGQTRLKSALDADINGSALNSLSVSGSYSL